MDWETLLGKERLLRPDAEPQPGRTPFQQDLDRIVFSAAFRRLAHKTQVHPLSDNDHVHTRLTHSIEVASVGRSLGTIVGSTIAGRLCNSKITADTFGDIVQAACLAHDIGNPPFGHSGEDSIGRWFDSDVNSSAIFGSNMKDVEKNDLRYFEGNAQGFRILTQIENNPWSGGLQLTYAVLGTFTKYPRSSVGHPILQDSYIGRKKIGFFESERDNFETVAQHLDLTKHDKQSNYWSRHPLAFLVEAADDICYAIIDIEDGFALGYLTFEEAKAVLKPIARDVKRRPDMENSEIIGKLRAVAIGELVDTASKAFLENEEALLAGTYSKELIADTPYKENIDEAKSIAKKKIYWSERKTKIEIAGSEIISGLLDLYLPVVDSIEHLEWGVEKLSGQPQMLARVMSNQFQGVSSRYEAWLRVTDFISGMTDRYALDLYRKLKGISI